jgi:regulatory protein
MNYLARREHSVLELTQKLAQAGFDTDEIDSTLNKLQQDDLQSDLRFSESFINARVQRGYGSIRIRSELQQRGVDASLIETTLTQVDIDWFALAVEVRSKRFGEEAPVDFATRGKQQRFLQYRGFTHEQIKESFNQTNEK